ncbi:hypothetical protein VTI74DRAFT_7882 [Chaetomium olivicolor]
MGMLSPLRLITFFTLLSASLIHALPTAEGFNHATTNRISPLARRSVSVDLTPNPDYSPNGPAVYARALQKWGAEVPRSLTKSLAAMRSAVGEVAAFSVRNDREYLSRVGFGTPLQWLDMDLDTGSSDVWVYSSEMRKSVAGDRPVWVIEDSETAKKVGNATWTIAYGDGSRAWGNVYTDTLCLGTITLANATIESAVSASLSLTFDLDLDGIFGLAYNLPSQTFPQQPTVLSQLLPHLAAPLFTADLRWHSAQGAYTFGYIDRSRHNPDTPILYTPLVPNATFWQVPFTGVHVGGDEKWYLANFSGIVDTGTSLLLLSRDIATLYYGAVPGAQQNWTVGGLWTYPCDNGGRGALPDFEIGFGSGFVATIPGRYMNYTMMPDDPDTCMGGLQEWEYESFGILGDVFLKAVYAVFDVGNGRVGFGEKVGLEDESGE